MKDRVPRPDFIISRGKLGLISSDIESYEFKDIVNKTQELLLTDKQGRLTPKQTTELEHSLTTLGVFFYRERKPMLFRKRAEANAERAGARIIEIGKELSRLTTRHFVKNSPLSKSERQIIEDLVFGDNSDFKDKT